MLPNYTLTKLFFILCVSLFAMQTELGAQMIIGTPNLGFSQACASETFNTYNATFVFSPESAAQSSNQFIVEMSDAEGDFSNAVVLFTSAEGAVTTSPATLEFSLPEDTAGENYRIRIKSTAPASTSVGSTPFAAYYKLQDSPFTINNLVSTGAFCAGGSYLLTIDNPGTGSNDSPLLYPSLTFNWYKETGPTTSVFVAEGETLEVTEEGTYFVETNYGTCTSNSFSNRVTISEAVSGEANATIVSSLGNPYCPEQGLTTLSTIDGNTYQWYRNGIAIENATSQTYQTNESGEFTVQVDLGECEAAGSIELVSELFEASIDVDEEITIEDGESVFVTVTTDANSPEIWWYYNDELINSESQAAYSASESGDYRVVVTETIGCQGSREFQFTINQAVDPFPDVAKIPNVISPNGDMINDTWVIPPQFTTGSQTEVTILTNQGKVVLKTNNYLNNWPETDLGLTSINQVYYYIIKSNNETLKGTITVIK